MNKDKIIEGEPIENETEEELKNENSFKKFWKKTKDGFNNMMLDNKIETAFNNQNTEYTIYQKDELISTTVYGYLDGDKIIVFGDKNPKLYSIITDQSTNKLYYIKGLAKTTVDVVVDGVTYNRPGTIFETEDEVVEVNVIKAGKKYYLYKGE